MAPTWYKAVPGLRIRGRPYRGCFDDGVEQVAEDVVDGDLEGRGSDPFRII